MRQSQYSAIMCRVRDNKFDVEFSTGIDIDPAWWDLKRERCRSDVRAGTIVNKRLDEINDKVLQIMTITRMEHKRNPSKDEVKNFVLGFEVSKMRLVEFAQEYLDSLKGRTNKRTGVTIQEKTITKQELIRVRVMDFENESRRKVYLHEADMDFYHAFSKYLVELGYRINYIAKHMSIIRTWLREAEVGGYQVHPAFRSTRWYIGRERVDHVSLSLVELERMNSLELENYLERVRDLFMISCFTGLRYSDVRRLDKAVIVDGVLNIEQQKTSDAVTVAVHPIVQRIIEKYRTRGQSYPVPLSNGRMNEVLKEVALLAGLTDNVVMRTTKGGKRVEETFPKWKLVTTHTARRSFAKNLYLTGFKLEYLSRVMGHKSLEQTVEYIGLDAIEKAAMLKEHWA